MGPAVNKVRTRVNKVVPVTTIMMLLIAKEVAVEEEVVEALVSTRITHPDDPRPQERPQRVRGRNNRMGGRV